MVYGKYINSTIDKIITDLSNYFCWFQLSSVVAERTLKSVGAKGMVVGHTPQTRGVNWYLLFSLG